MGNMSASVQLDHASLEVLQSFMSGRSAAGGHDDADEDELQTQNTAANNARRALSLKNPAVPCPVFS
jgi:hypothetical protein